MYKKTNKGGSGFSVFIKYWALGRKCKESHSHHLLVGSSVFQVLSKTRKSHSIINKWFHGNKSYSLLRRDPRNFAKIAVCVSLTVECSGKTEYLSKSWKTSEIVITWKKSWGDSLFFQCAKWSICGKHTFCYGHT